MICPFNILDGDYAWLDEKLQTQTANLLTGKFNGDQYSSQIKNKKNKEKCTPVTAFYQQFNPGMDCTNDLQCVSKFCFGNFCDGRGTDTTCHQHSDCLPGNYCRTQKLWPFRSLCTELKGDYDLCSSDYECSISSYCWYASPTDRQYSIMKCLPLYSQEDGTIFGWYSNASVTNLTLADYTQNGKYCASGLAYQFSPFGAKCTSLT
jgi:hypothetical protein